MTKKAEGFKKTTCPLTLKQFVDKAEPIVLKIGDQTIHLDPREFSSGSFGWGFSGKVVLDTCGKPCKVQCSMNLVLVGSKPEPKAKVKDKPKTAE